MVRKGGGIDELLATAGGCVMADTAEYVTRDKQDAISLQVPISLACVVPAVMLVVSIVPIWRKPVLDPVQNRYGTLHASEAIQSLKV